MTHSGCDVGSPDCMKSRSKVKKAFGLCFLTVDTMWPAALCEDSFFPKMFSLGVWNGSIGRGEELGVKTDPWWTGKQGHGTQINNEDEKLQASPSSFWPQTKSWERSSLTGRVIYCLASSGWSHKLKVRLKHVYPKLRTHQLHFIGLNWPTVN